MYSGVDADNEYERILFLLNFLTDQPIGPGAPWSIRRAHKAPVDEMGVQIEDGERFFVRRDRAK